VSDIYVGVTDKGWYEHLRGLSAADEVNFWRPSPGTFRALDPGGLFLFKLHYPENAVVGGGIFAHASVLPLSLAWDAFGVKNGVASLGAMIDRLASYRSDMRTLPVARRVGVEIGCLLIEQPFFFGEESWLTLPEWQPTIVSGKGFSLDTEAGQALLREVQDRLRGMRPSLTLPLELPRHGRPYVMQPRLGQGSFRVLVTDAYERRCAVTGERVLPVLEAAHIIPFADGGPNAVTNGLLLRSDLHTLFDRGYLAVTPDHNLAVSGRIREEWENGREYYALDGRAVRPPALDTDRPDPQALQWHLRERFVA